MPYIVLKNLHHRSLVLRWTLFEISGKRQEIWVGRIGNFVSLHEIQYMIVTFELFLSTIYDGFLSGTILRVGLVIDSGIGHISFRILFFQCHLETRTVGLNELEFA